MNKVSARSKRSKQPARKARKVGTTAVDRRLLAKAKREEQESGKIKPAESAKPVHSAVAPHVRLSRKDVTEMAGTLAEQMDRLIDISDGLTREADEAEIALSILVQLKIIRNELQCALEVRS